MKVTKFNLMQTIGGVAGGAAAKFVGSFINSDGDNNYVEIGVQAVAGAAISAFSGNDALKGVGAGMIGVAGYNLAKQLGFGETEQTPVASGLGLLPSQNAISALPFRYRGAIQGVETKEEKEEKVIKSNVQ